MSTISLLSEEASWRSRAVQYFSADWPSIWAILPEFELVSFAAGEGEPKNPYLQTVMRKPLTATERPMPVGVVSHSYSLAQHRDVAALCRQVLVDEGIDPSGLHYEVGLSELGEWMNFRIYFPKEYCFEEASGLKLDLRLECFNSVDGSSRLVILFGWYRLICSNGLVIGKTKIEIRERHGQGLDLASVPGRIRPAFREVEVDRARMKQWRKEKIDINDVADWANESISETWGKKAAARVFHICESGRDVRIDNPFAPGAATEKPIRYLQHVPGAPERAETKYHALQALSFVATRRKNAEERLSWQADIPHLLRRLSKRPTERIG